MSKSLYQLIPARRQFLKGFIAALAVAPLTSQFIAAAEKTDDSKSKKPLVVYFSESGNTRRVAEEIHKKVGGDILEIKTVKPYPKDYDTLVEYAKQEQKRGERPALSSQVPNLDEYGIIFLGYPNWWSGLPMPIYSFAEQSKLDGKTVAPFMTHGGGGTGHTESELKKLLPHSQVLKTFAAHGTRAGSVEKDLQKWIEGLGPALIMTTTGNPAIYPNGAY